MRGHSRLDALLYVVANKPLESQRAFGRSLGAETIRYDELSKHLGSDPSVVFDVDLRKIDIVRILKTSLSRHGNGCRIFLVDPSSRVSGVHAKVLGADVMLPTDANASDIHAAIRAHFGIRLPTGSADAAVLQSIDAGVEAMDGSFQSLEGGLDLSMSGVNAASGQIADAISGVGVDDWLATVKGYHVGTYQHCMLVTGVASAFGTGTGMARRDVIKLTIAGMLHDIGKAAIPLAILDKPSALTEAETQIVRTHPTIGDDYLAKRSAVGADIRRVVRGHHEMLDGTGYPDGLMGSEIDDLTRILTICDIYGALVERRSYKEPKTAAQAMIILNAMAHAGKLETSLVREFGRIMLNRQAA